MEIKEASAMSACVPLTRTDIAPSASECFSESNTHLMRNFYAHAIDARIAEQVQNKLSSGMDVILQYDTSISVTASIAWHSNNDLTIKSKYNITIQENVTISNLGSGTLRIMAGIETNNPTVTVSFADSSIIMVPNGGKVKIYYNPTQGDNFHKYHSPQSFDDFIAPSHSVMSYMLVNDHLDLSAIRYFPSMNYALANNIAPQIKVTMEPIGNAVLPFTGSFDGNGFTISNLMISGNDNVGLFGVAITGGVDSVIENFKLYSCVITGNHYVGAIAGVTENFKYSDIQLESIKIEGKEMVGGAFGVMTSVEYLNIRGFMEECAVSASEVFGLFAGVLIDTKIPDEDNLQAVGIVYHSNGTDEEFE